MNTYPKHWLMWVTGYASPFRATDEDGLKEAEDPRLNVNSSKFYVHCTVPSILWFAQSKIDSPYQRYGESPRNLYVTFYSNLKRNPWG
jgi:hypothetical protein